MFWYSAEDPANETDGKQMTVVVGLRLTSIQTTQLAHSAYLFSRLIGLERLGREIISQIKEVYMD